MTDMTLRAAGQQRKAVDASRGVLVTIGRRWQALSALPGIGTWIGVGLIATGMVLVALSWGITATEVVVTKQLPVLLGVGGSGLALTVIGACVVNLAAKRADALERRAQLEQLRELVNRLLPSDEELS